MGDVTLQAFRAEARAWLELNATVRPTGREDLVEWGVGSDSVALFQNLTLEEERAHIDEHRSWLRRKADAGWAYVSWDPAYGGRGLDREFERVFAQEESAFVVPARHEAISITADLVAPTIARFGTDEQRERFVASALRTDDLWCQLFSEPGAGSDLAAVATTAERDGDEWILTGQKVWTSGAQFADWGLAVCRSDWDAPKHRGLTAFIVPMDADGVEVRPLRQITGGASFNEVFLTGVRISDALRLGDEGEGWTVALTTLGFERGAGGAYGGTRSFWRLATLARHLGVEQDGCIRQQLADLYIHQRLQVLTSERVRGRLGAGEMPGPEASIGKLFWTKGLALANDTAARLLGPMLVADSGRWGTYAWSEHLLGTAGYRIAAGTDEVQRTIIGERVLGLPQDPRSDRDVPFRDARR